MNFGQYEAFVKAVEAGTMTQAAEELGYSQSGLTRALSSLEEEWGVRLLMRGRNGVQLTPEGERLLPDIRTVLHDQGLIVQHDIVAAWHAQNIVDASCRKQNGKILYVILIGIHMIRIATVTPHRNA